MSEFPQTFLANPSKRRIYLCKIVTVITETLIVFRIVCMIVYTFFPFYPARKINVAKFRKKKVMVLIATDVAVCENDMKHLQLSMQW